MFGCTIFHNEYSATFSILQSRIHMTNLTILTTGFSLYPLFQMKADSITCARTLTLSGLKIRLFTTGNESNLHNVQFSKSGSFFNVSDYNVKLEDIEIENAISATVSRAPMFQQLIHFSVRKDNFKFSLAGLKLYDIGICYSLLSLSSQAKEPEKLFTPAIKGITFEKVDIKEKLGWWQKQKPKDEDFSLFQIITQTDSKLILEHITLIETFWDYSVNSMFFNVSHIEDRLPHKVSSVFINSSEIGNDLFVFNKAFTIIIEDVQILNSIIKEALLWEEAYANLRYKQTVRISNIEIVNSVLCRDTFWLSQHDTREDDNIYFLMSDLHFRDVYFLHSCNELHLPDANGTGDLKQQFDTYVASYSEAVKNTGSFIFLHDVGAAIQHSSFENIWLFGHVLVNMNAASNVTLAIFNTTFSSFTGLDSSARLISKQQLNIEDREYFVKYDPATYINIDYVMLNYVSLINNTFSGSWLFEQSSEIITLEVAHLFVVGNNFKNMDVSSVSTLFWISELGPVLNKQELRYWNVSQGLNDLIKIEGFGYHGSRLDKSLMDILLSRIDGDTYKYGIGTIVYAFSENSFLNFTSNSPSLILFENLSPYFSAFLFERSTFDSCTFNTNKTPTEFDKTLISYPILNFTQTSQIMIRNNTISNSKDASIIWLNPYIEDTVKVDLYVDSEYEGSNSTGQKDSPFRYFYEAAKRAVELDKESDSNGYKRDARIILLGRPTNYTINSSNIIIYNCRDLEIVGLIDGSYNSSPVIALEGSLIFDKTTASIGGVDFFAQEPSEYKININNSRLTFANTNFSWYAQPMPGAITKFIKSDYSNLVFLNSTFPTFRYNTQGPNIMSLGSSAIFIKANESVLMMSNCTIFDDEYSASFSILNSQVTLVDLVINTTGLSLYPLFQLTTNTAYNQLANLIINGLKINIFATGLEDDLHNILFSKIGPFFSVLDHNVVLENIDIQSASVSHAPMFRQLIQFSGTRKELQFKLARLKLHNIGVCYRLISVSALDISLVIKEIAFEKVHIREAQDWWQKQEPIKEEVSLFQFRVDDSTDVTFEDIKITETVWNNNSANSSFFDISGLTQDYSISSILINASEIGGEFFVFEDIEILIFYDVEVVNSIIKKGLLRAKAASHFINDPSFETISNIQVSNSILCNNTFEFGTAVEKNSDRIPVTSLTDFHIHDVYLLNSCDDLTLSDSFEDISFKQYFDDYIASHSELGGNTGSFISVRDVAVTIKQSSFENIWIYRQVLVSVDGTQPKNTVTIFGSTFSSFTGLDASARFISKRRLDFEERNYQDNRVTFNYIALVSNTFSDSWLFDKAPEIMTLNVAHLLVVDNKFEDMSVSSVRTLFSASEFGPVPSDVKLRPWDVSQGLNDPITFLYSKVVNRTIMKVVLERINTSILASFECRIDTIVYLFAQNSFVNVTLSSPSLLSFRTLSPNFTVFLFENNTFDSCNFNDRTTDELKMMLIPYIMLELTQNPSVIIRGNMVASSKGASTFVSTVCERDPSSNVLIKANVFENNSDLTFLSVTGNSYNAINITDNYLDSSLSRIGSILMVRLTKGPDKYTRILNNTFTGITVAPLNYDEPNNLITLEYPRNYDNHSISIDRLNVTNCTFDLKGLVLLKTENIYMIRFSSYKSNLIVSNMTITNNTGSLYYASLAAFYGQTVAFWDLTLTSNPPQRVVGQDFAGNWKNLMYVVTANFSLFDSGIKSNTAVQGGAFALDSESETYLTLKIERNEFEMNFAQSYGGVFYIQPSFAASPESRYVIKGNITANRFKDNYAHQEKGGGILWLNNSVVSELTISDSTIYIDNSSCFSFMNIYSPSGQKQLVLLSNLSFPIKSSAGNRSHLTLIHFASTSENTNRTNYNLKNISFYGETTEGTRTELEPEPGSLNQISLLSVVNVTLTAERLTIIGIQSSENFIQLMDTNAVIHNVLIKDNHILATVNTATIISTQTYGEIQKSLSLKDSTFENNTGSKIGGVLNSEKTSVRISNCSFSNNSALIIGGALALIDCESTIIQNSSFISNFVASVNEVGGGALYWQTSSKSWPQFIIKDSTFIENCALKGQGGAILLSNTMGYYNKVIIDSIKSHNLFSKNTARVGNNISTGPSEMKLTLYQKKLDEYTIPFDTANELLSSTKQYYFGQDLPKINSAPILVEKDLKSGMKFPRKMMSEDFSKYILNFTLFDFFDNSLATFADQAGSTIYSSLRVDLVQSNSTIDSQTCSAGWCALNGDNIILKGLANESKELGIYVHQGDTTVVSFVLLIELRPCVPGEINKTKDRFCEICPPGRYSLDSEDTGCSKCPSEGVQCLGGSILKVDEGYWRPNNRSDNIYKCEKSIACIGTTNLSNLDDVCNTKFGYRGPLCLSCDLENNFQRKSDGFCARCPEPWFAIFAAIVYNLSFFLIEFFFVNKMHQKNRSLLDSGPLDKEAISALSSRGYLSIFLMYFQIFAVIKTLSLFVVKFLQTLSPEVNPSQTLLYSLDCALKDFEVPVEDIYYWKVAFIGGIPFFKIAVLSLYALIRRRLSSQFHSKSYIAAVILNIVVFEQPGVLQTMLSMLICQSSDKNVKDQSQVFHFVRDAPNIECGVGLYTTFYYYIAIPSIVLWAIIIPLAYSLLLWKNTHRLREDKFARYCGTLYIIYEDKYFMWGQVEMMMKILITFASQFDTGDVASRGVTVTLILALYYSMLRNLKPYIYKDLGITAERAVLIYIVSIFLAVYGMISHDWLKDLTGVIIVGTNICFMVFLSYKTFEVYQMRKYVKKFQLFFNRCLGRKSKIEQQTNLDLSTVSPDGRSLLSETRI